ncbi:MAG: GNAT family N-acetyltransferase [Thermoplasmata archaeon]|nr:GNAT family N-acetyltransferase [Thermoplasmata archaeon]
MAKDLVITTLENLRKTYPDKFITEERIFRSIHRGDTIFIGTGCGEPQYLVSALSRFVESNPKAFFDAEVIHVWTLGVAPYAKEKFKKNFRHNSFFIGENTRNAINSGLADYTPIFLSEVPNMFRSGMIDIDVALIQVSPPDIHGYMSLGISVDIVKAAIESASLIIVQINPLMPRVHGDGFIHIDDIDFAIIHEEPLLEFQDHIEGDVTQKIGEYVSRLVQDGDTIQVGYGNLPNAIVSNLKGKKDLGIHTELLSNGLVELIRSGVVNNSKKSIDRGKTVASFCMGSRETYEYLNDNPSIEFRSIEYTNDPLIISKHSNLTAINSALEIDLTGQSTAESLGKTFYSGIGGQADFMRGAVLSRNGKTILALPSTADGDKASRIVPFLMEGAGVTLTRGDIHYVVTEYGIAYLHGKNIRERALELISIAHPKFRPGLIREAKKRNLIYNDQAFIPGKKGEYPEDLETYRSTKENLDLLLRPVKISDEPLLKDFYYSLSDRSMYRRFISARKDMPHERLQDFVIIDHTKEVVILAIKKERSKEIVLAIGQYAVDLETHTAEAAFAVRDGYQNQGISTELLKYLTFLAKKQGLLGFTAEVLMENREMLHVFEKMGFDIQRSAEESVYELKMAFRMIT